VSADFLRDKAVVFGGTIKGTPFITEATSLRDFSMGHFVPKTTRINCNCGNFHKVINSKSSSV
jgi:hypothetical protein